MGKQFFWGQGKNVLELNRVMVPQFVNILKLLNCKKKKKTVLTYYLNDSKRRGDMQEP